VYTVEDAPADIDRRVGAGDLFDMETDFVDSKELACATGTGASPRNEDGICTQLAEKLTAICRVLLHE